MERRFFSSLDESEKRSVVADMRRVKDLLEDTGAQVYLSGGTLLGAIREDDFIAWDWDIEYMVVANDYDRFRFIRSLFGEGFAVKLQLFSGAPKIVVYRTGMPIEIFEFEHGVDYYTRAKKMKIPSEFFQKTETRSFHSIHFLVPSPVEKYLEWRYGDWQTPKRFDPQDKSYLTDSFRSRNQVSRKERASLPGRLKRQVKLTRRSFWRGVDLLIVTSARFMAYRR